jgi:hypothetical protein
MVLLQDDEVNAQRIALHLKLRVDTGRVYSPAKFLAASTTKEQLLDVVGTMLAFSAPPKMPPVSNGRGGRLYLGSHVNPERENAVDALQDMLTLAGSSYRVNDARTGLELRIDETAQ